MYSTDQEKADALNLFVCKNFNESISPITPLDSNYENDPCPNLLCTVEEVTSMLSSLDTTKASGPDGISGKMLKQTATAIAPSITALFNLSIKINVTNPQRTGSMQGSYQSPSSQEPPLLVALDLFLSYQFSANCLKSIFIG